MLDLKKLMLVSLICCVSIQQTDAKVVYSPDKTEKFMQKINKNKHANINDAAHKAFTSLLPTNTFWYNHDLDIKEYFTKHLAHYEQFLMPGIAAFVPTRNNSDINKAKVYVGWKYAYNSTDPNTIPPNNTPDKRYGNARLFEYSDFSHTERQLAICALNNANANNKETEITEDSPNIGVPIGLSDNRTAKAKKKAATKITDRMFNTEGILCIYTRALPCTSSKDFSKGFKENGGMLCVDYYAHLLQACPKIKIHVYCNLDDISSLPADLLDNVDCKLIYNKMSQFFPQIEQKVPFTSPIKYIMNNTIVPTESGWQFTKKEELTKNEQADIDEYILFPTKINQDIMKAVKRYIQPSTSSKDLATSGEILTTLIRLFLRYKHPDTPSKTFDRLTVHLLAPLTKW